jgi:hypothetical protein
LGYTPKIEGLLSWAATGGVEKCIDSLQRLPMVRIRLTRKLAARLNGVDVSKFKVGDLLELPDVQALMLVKEGWAVVETAKKDAEVGESPRTGDSEELSA